MSSVKTLCEAARWLDQPISYIQAKKFGWFKKRALLRGSALKGEDAYEGPSTFWFGINCPTLIGTLRGTIFKVAMTAIPLKFNPDNFFEAVREDISQKLKTTGKSTPDGFVVWDADDGNVVLQSVPGEIFDEAVIFITSNIARSFS